MRRWMKELDRNLDAAVDLVGLAVITAPFLAILAVLFCSCGSVLVDLTPEDGDAGDVTSGDAGDVEQLDELDAGDVTSGDGEDLVELDELPELDAGDGCDPWFLDLDGDTWGDDGHTACGPAAGYVPVSGDCCDRLADVNPDALGWRTEPYSCGDGPSWDGNCDDLVEVHDVVCWSCRAVAGGGCELEASGWEAAADGTCSLPACGESGRAGPRAGYGGCYQPAIETCTTSPGAVEDRVQACR